MTDESRPPDQPTPPPQEEPRPEPRPPWEQPASSGGEAESIDPNEIVSALQNEAARQHEQHMQQIEQEEEGAPQAMPSEEEIWNMMEEEANLRQREPETERGEHPLTEFEKLCKLGYLETTVTIGGNDIVLRTLDQKEDLEALSKSGTHPIVTQSRAYHLYSLSRAMKTINGEPWFTQISLTEEDNTIDKRFQRILKLKPTITSILIAEYLDLQQEAIEKAEYARKKS